MTYEYPDAAACHQQLRSSSAQIICSGGRGQRAVGWGEGSGRRQFGARCSCAGENSGACWLLRRNEEKRVNSFILFKKIVSGSPLFSSHLTVCVKGVKYSVFLLLIRCTHVGMVLSPADGSALWSIQHYMNFLLVVWRPFQYEIFFLICCFFHSWIQSMKKAGSGFCLRSHSSWYRPAGFFAGMPSGAQHSLCGMGWGCFGAVGFLPFLGTGGVSPEGREHKPLPFFPMERVKREWYVLH